MIGQRAFRCWPFVAKAKCKMYVVDSASLWAFSLCSSSPLVKSTIILLSHSSPLPWICNLGSFPLLANPLHCSHIPSSSGPQCFLMKFHVPLVLSNCLPMDHFHPKVPLVTFSSQRQSRPLGPLARLPYMTKGQV